MANDFQSIIDAGMSLGALKQDRGFAVVPEGSYITDLEAYGELPRRKRGTVNLVDQESFMGYVTDHKEAGTAIFADPRELTFRAVMDYHITNSNFEGELPQNWKEHKVVFALQETREWRLWKGKNGHVMDQVTLATFLEERIEDVRTPPGAELLELCQDLDDRRQARVRSAVRLDNGYRQFTYEEEESAGTIKVPGEFTINLPLFEKMDPVEMVVKLRYRVRESALQFWFNIHNWQDYERAMFDQSLDDIKLGTVVPLYLGTAS